MISMFINGEEVVCKNEFTITEEMLKTSSTILNNCYPKSWEQDKDYVSRFYFPPDYSKCLIYKDSDLIFCGVVKNTGNINLNPREPHYCSLQVLDFKTFLSEGETLDFVISNKTVSEAITLVANAISQYGFVLGNIQITNDDVIGAYSTLNQTAYDVFQYLADISQSRWTTRMIDQNTVAIDFYDPELLPTANNIEYNETYFNNNNIVNMKYSYSTNDYRNKQIINSTQVNGNVDYIETIMADGYATTYNTSNNISILKAITVNGTSATIATLQDKEIGIYADFYYEYGKNQITSAKDLAAGTILNITYTPLVNGRQVVINENEIARINSQTNRKGTITRYETRNDITSSEELEAIGKSYLKFKGIAEIKLTIKTKNANLFNIGEVAYFDAPINNLQNNYMCKKKTTQIIATTNDIFYTFELTNSYNSESEINYFDNQRRKNAGNIEQGNYIDRNIDIINGVNVIFSNLTTEEIEADTNNVLNCALNSIFIQ